MMVCVREFRIFQRECWIVFERAKGKLYRTFAFKIMSSSASPPPVIPHTIPLPDLPPLPNGQLWKQNEFRAFAAWASDASRLLPPNQRLLIYLDLQVKVGDAMEIEKDVLVLYGSHTSSTMSVFRVDNGTNVTVGTHSDAIKISGVFVKAPAPLAPPQQQPDLQAIITAISKSLERQVELEQQRRQDDLQLNAKSTAEAAARRAHEEKIFTFQERTLKAEEENANRLAKVEARKHDTVYLRKYHNLDIPNLPGLTEAQIRLFDDMAFPPLGATASSGFNSACAIMLAHHAIHEGLRITSATKENDLQKLAEKAGYVRDLLTRVMVKGGRQVFDTDNPKFDCYIVFHIGLESVMHGPRFSSMIPDGKARNELRAKMLAAYGLTEPTRVSVESEKVRLSTLSSDSLPILTTPNPFKAYWLIANDHSLVSSHSSFKEKKRIHGGGTSQPPASHMGVLQVDGVVDIPELAPRCYISAPIIDAVLRPLNKLYSTLGKRYYVFYPDALRQLPPERLLKSFDSARRHHVGFLAPTLVGGNHWILVVGTHRHGEWLIRTFDSLPSQRTREETSRLLGNLTTKVPQLTKATIATMPWLTQPLASNDCALFVMRAALVTMAPEITPTRSLSLFQRRDLLAIFAQTVDKSTGAFPLTLSSAHFDLIKQELLAHIEEKVPRPILNVPAPEDEVEESPQSRIPKAFSAQLEKSHSSGSKTTAPKKTSATDVTTLPQYEASAHTTGNSDNKETLNNLVQLDLFGNPVPGSRCPFVRTDTKLVCDKHLKPGQGVKCPTCHRNFCAEHFNHNMVQRPDWKCVDCREAKHYTVRCAFPCCNLNHGLVDILHARICSSCTRPFHNAHHKVTKGQDFVCTECRTGHLREEPTGDYSMPHDPVRDAQDFQLGQGSPFLASRQGTSQFIRRLKETLDTSVIHPLANVGLKPTTREAHIRALNLLITAPCRCLNWPLARTAIEVLELERRRGNKGRGKTWSTTNTWVGHMAGALTRLPLYTRDRMEPIVLSLDPEWKDASTTTSRMARQFSKTGLPAATFLEVQQAIATARDTRMKAALIINWACMARIGDTLQVLTKEVAITRTSTGACRLIVYFCEGKVIGRGKVDPYHIHADIPHDMADILEAFVKSVKTKHLFHMASKAERQQYTEIIRQHLRTINPKLDCRALRRGALQTFASAPGVTMQMVLYFSKHTDIGMLRRYLRFGKAPSEESSRAASHTIILWQ